MRQVFIVGASICAALAVGAILCVAGDVRGGGEKRSSRHWCVTGSHAKAVDLAGTGIADDAVIFYEQEFGIIPRYWKGKMEHGGVPQEADLNAHIAKVRRDVVREIPNPNWSGCAIIDLEAWGPLWEPAAEEYKRQSITLAARNHPTRSRYEVERLAKANYESAARRLILATIRECKSLRPRAKWGFYSWPYPEWGAETGRLAWLWNEVTAMYPVCYVVYKSAEGGRHEEGFAPPGEYEEHCRNLLALHRRLAESRKPVLPMVWVRYHEINKVFDGQFLDQRDLERMLRLPIEEGGDGLVFWDHIASESMAREYGVYMRDRVAPLLRQ